VLTLPFHDVERRSGRSGLQEALVAMPIVFTYLDFVAAMRYRGGAAGDGAETCKVALSEARRDGWVVGLFGHWGGPAARQVPTYFNVAKAEAHPAGRRAVKRGLPVWRPWLERAVGLGALSAVEIGPTVIEDAGWIPRCSGRPLIVTGETAAISPHEDVSAHVVAERRPAGWLRAMRGHIVPLRDRRAPLVALDPPAALADALVFGEGMTREELDACFAAWRLESAEQFRHVAIRLQALVPCRGRASPIVFDDAPVALARRLARACVRSHVARLPDTACA
jgi:hypothetical protein